MDMKRKSITHFCLRAAMTLLVALLTSTMVKAQYVFVIANPANAGEVRVGKTTDLGAYMDGSHFLFDAEPGETIYFDFRPYSGWQFTGTITNDADLADLTLLDNGLYSFTMPEYEGMLMINIKIFFEEEPVVVEGVDINEENFPDANFRNWLLSQSYGTDAVITDAEMAGITKIVARGCGIENLTGIQFFTELTELDVSNSEEMHPAEQWNHISSIDLSGNTKLRVLWLDNNQIASIDLSPCSDLRKLGINNNLLTTLDVSQNVAMTMLSCENNKLTALNVTQNTGLAVLSCCGNQLTVLDVTENMVLEQLYCENNQLTSIDVTNHDKMMLFNCNNNQLTSLDLTGCTELYQLYCYNNQISGEAMTNMVNSLETPPRGGYMVVVDLDSDIEQNDITAEQAAVARAKTWSVEAIENNHYIQYPKTETHEYVDLGLTSGTLWATCNVGANNPQDAGDYFAWGDTVGHGKDVPDGYWFIWENYKWCEVSGEYAHFTKYCSDSSLGKDGFTDGEYELAPEDDAAYVNWGSEWRTPTKEQFDELLAECEWTQTTYRGVNGYEVTGPNGNTIFLPETGWRMEDLLLDGGAYWSRSSDPDDVGGAFYLGWDEWGWYEFGGRLDGQCVRPVVNKLLELPVDADNTETITTAAAESGVTYDVKLTGRTLYKDGSWNSLTLPFSLSEEQVEKKLRKPEQIMTLNASEFNNETGTLTLNFTEVTEIEAGTPYIIKWAKTDDYVDDNLHNICEPTFSGVTVSEELDDIVTDVITFKGLFAPLSIGDGGDNTLLYLGIDNKLYYPGIAMNFNAFYAYFKLADGYECGSSQGGNSINSFVLNFGGEETSITHINADFKSSSQESGISNLHQQNSYYYSLDGRRINGMPIQKGIYIKDGKRVVVK